MKKFIKNLIIVSLLVIATIVVIPNVFAEFSTNNNSLTVSGLETNTDKDVSVNLYKIIDVNTKNGQPQSPVYKWNTNVAKWLNEKAPSTYKDYIDDDGNVTDAFNKALEQSKVIDKFYDDLSAAIRGGKDITLSPVDTKTAKNVESVTFTGLDLGVYFVLANGGMKVYKPTSINIVPEKDQTSGDWVVKNNSVELKSSSPSIVKTVEDAQQAQAAAATGFIGKKVKYTLKITVPHYPENTTNKTLYIEDQLSNGLDFIADTTGDYAMVVKSDTGVTLKEDTNFSLDYTDRKLTLHFDGDGTPEGKNKYYDTIKTYDEITITYYATVNENAIVKADNTATLHYNNDPYGKSDPEPSTPEVTVYTYGFDVTKVDKNNPNGDPLKGAEFVISKNADASNPLKFVALDGKPGEYRLAKDGEEGADEKLVATNGTLKVYGLDTGDYYVKETKAPTGYVINPIPQKKTLTDAEPDGKLEGDGDNLLTFKFENSDSIIDLPVTGGIGTLIFSIIGVLFMGTSIVLVRNILKKKEVQL